MNRRALFYKLDDYLSHKHHVFETQYATKFFAFLLGSIFLHIFIHFLYIIFSMPIFLHIMGSFVIWIIYIIIDDRYS